MAKTPSRDFRNKKTNTSDAQYLYRAGYALELLTVLVIGLDGFTD